MSIDRRLLPAVAITGSSILVGCSGSSGSSCGTYGSYGSYSSYGVAGARARSARSRRGVNPANMGPSADSYAGCGAPANAAAGIYEGNVTNEITQQATPVVAIIAENGDAVMSGQHGTYYRLNVETWGYNVAGSFSAYSHGPVFPDDKQSFSGSVSGVLTTSGLIGTLADQNGGSDSLSLRFDNAYDLASTLPTFGGSWNSTAADFSLTATIGMDGTLSAPGRARWEHALLAVPDDSRHCQLGEREQGLRRQLERVPGSINPPGHPH